MTRPASKKANFHVGNLDATTVHRYKQIVLLWSRATGAANIYRKALRCTKPGLFYFGKWIPLDINCPLRLVAGLIKVQKALKLNTKICSALSDPVKGRSGQHQSLGLWCI